MAKQPEMSEREQRDLCERAGVLPSELQTHPEYGLLISPSGVQKLKVLSTNKAGVALVGQLATEAARSRIRLVPKSS